MGIKRNIKSAVVLGATGFIGNFLVEALVEEGIRVIAAVRKESQKRLRTAADKLVEILYIEEDIADSLKALPEMQEQIMTCSLII